MTDDAIYAEAVALVRRERRASTSFIQRHLHLGYNKTASLVERMEAEGLVSPADHAGKREVLMPLDHAAPTAPAEIGHNSAVDVFSAADHNAPDVLTLTAQGRLKSMIERVERLEEDKAAVLNDIKEVFAEAKGEGFDPKIMRKVIRLRKQDKVKREQEEALVDLYLAAIGGL